MVASQASIGTMLVLSCAKGHSLELLSRHKVTPLQVSNSKCWAGMCWAVAVNDSEEQGFVPGAKCAGF